MAIQGHWVKTALLPLLTQHTQLGHSHSQHPERATATGEMPAREQHPRAWAGRAARRMLPNPALLETSPTQELTPMYTVACLCRDVFASKGKSRELGSRSLPLWHPSEVEPVVNVKLWGHEKGLLVCLILGDPQGLLQHTLTCPESRCFLLQSQLQQFYSKPLPFTTQFSHPHLPGILPEVST